MPTRQSVTKPAARTPIRTRAAVESDSHSAGDSFKANLQRNIRSFYEMARAIGERQCSPTNLRRAIRSFYDSYRREKWLPCFNRIDPQLREGSKVDFDGYQDSLQTFREAYGDVSILTIVLSEVHRSKHDPRPFAFASIVWRDRSHEFHVFRERWVFDGKRWYTRVVGLVTHQSPSAN